MDRSGISMIHIRETPNKRFGKLKSVANRKHWKRKGNRTIGRNESKRKLDFGKGV
jgi:hypothetical protein